MPGVFHRSNPRDPGIPSFARDSIQRDRVERKSAPWETSNLSVPNSLFPVNRRGRPTPSPRFVELLRLYLPDVSRKKSAGYAIRDAEDNAAGRPRSRGRSLVTARYIFVKFSRRPLEDRSRYRPKLSHLLLAHARPCSCTNERGRNKFALQLCRPKYRLDANVIFRR